MYNNVHALNKTCFTCPAGHSGHFGYKSSATREKKNDKYPGGGFVKAVAYHFSALFFITCFWKQIGVYRSFFQQILTT